MPQGSFTAQVNAQVAKTKALMTAVYRGSAERTVEVMQEPGYSKATVKKAVAAGAGLGKVGKSGQRGVSKKALGPIANPGGAGNIPVDTGFLRASLMVSLGTANFALMPNPDPDKSYQYDEGRVSLVIAGASITDPITAVYTANYARVAEYGSRGRAPRRFVALAAQQWPQIVEQVSREAQSRVS